MNLTTHIKCKSLIANKCGCQLTFSLMTRYISPKNIDISPKFNSLPSVTHAHAHAHVYIARNSHTQPMSGNAIHTPVHFIDIGLLPVCLARQSATSRGIRYQEANWQHVQGLSLLSVQVFLSKADTYGNLEYLTEKIVTMKRNFRVPVNMAIQFHSRQEK